MEKLFAYAYIRVLDSDMEKDYCNYLDTLFMNEPDNVLLLELECCTDAEESLSRLKRYFDYEAKEFDAVLFGKSLFCGLRKVYHSLDIDSFAEKCYGLYSRLPVGIDNSEEPFFTLGYIDDVLECNGIKETEERIEEMLAFYERNDEQCRK